MCLSKLTIIASDNGLSPGRCHAIIRINAGILLIGALRNIFQWNLTRNSHILIHEMLLKLSSAEWRPFRHGLNVLSNYIHIKLWNVITHSFHISLQWRHNGHDSVSNHLPYDCLLNRLFRRRSKKTSKLRVTGLCTGNSPGTGEFPAQMASNAENVSIWWRHHVVNPPLQLGYGWVLHPISPHIRIFEPCRLKSSAHQLFVQQLVQATMEESIKTSHHLPFMERFHLPVGSRRASDAKIISLSWRHYDRNNGCNYFSTGLLPYT